MDNIVLKIRGLGLRIWILIAIVLSLLAMLPMTSSVSVTGYEASCILGLISTAILLGSILAYATTDMLKAKIALIFVAVGFFVGVLGVFVAFKDVASGILFEFLNALSPVTLNDLGECYAQNGATFIMLQNIALCVAVGITLSSCNKRFMVPCILMLCSLALSFLVIILFNTKDISYEKYIMYNAYVQVLSSIAIIWLLVIGGNSKQTSQNKSITQSTDNSTEKLLELKKLLDSGVLTQEEFDEEKKTLLSHDKYESSPTITKVKVTNVFNAEVADKYSWVGNLLLTFVLAAIIALISLMVLSRSVSLW